MDINLTAIMEREGIDAIKRWPAGRFSVELRDGRFGTAHTVGEALECAKAGVENIRKVAA